MFVFKEKKHGFLTSLSYRRPHFGLLDDALKVAYRISACFAECQMMFWFALTPAVVNSLVSGREENVFGLPD